MKCKNTKAEPWLFALLLFNGPLLTLWIPSWVAKAVITVLYQCVVIIAGYMYFENLHEEYRNEWLRKQRVISLLGIVIAFYLGYTQNVSELHSYIELYFTFFVTYPVFNALLYVFIYLLLDVVICGLGYYLHMMIELIIYHGHA